MNVKYDAPQKKLYAKLRGLFIENCYNTDEIAKKLGCSRAHLSALLCGKTSWKLDDCYTILDLFHIPHCELPTYFPKNGRKAA